jgi:hypothetical protein
MEPRFLVPRAGPLQIHLSTDSPDVALEGLNIWEIYCVCRHSKRVDFYGPGSGYTRPVKSHAEATDSREKRPGA